MPLTVACACPLPSLALRTGFEFAFDHVSIGVSDIKRAGTFYDAVLKPLDVTRLSDGESALGYGEKNAGLWLLASNKPVKPDRESGLHFCFQAKSRAAVDAFHGDE